jgi:mersacidin/lichenicidin family type 2 lantibiotic
MVLDILRAWKDPEYRKSLTPAQLALVPDNPAGDAELTADDLRGVSGGYADSVGTCAKSCVCTIVCKPIPKDVL